MSREAFASWLFISSERFRGMSQHVFLIFLVAIFIFLKLNRKDKLFQKNDLTKIRLKILLMLADEKLLKILWRVTKIKSHESKCFTA